MPYIQDGFLRSEENVFLINFEQQKVVWENVTLQFFFKYCIWLSYVICVGRSYCLSRCYCLCFVADVIALADVIVIFIILYYIEWQMV